MSSNPSQEYLDRLVGELRKLPTETGWVEFKENNTNPEDIGEYLSALSNMAAYAGKECGYLVWGIIADAVEDKLIKPADPEQGRKYARYLPFWA